MATIDLDSTSLNTGNNKIRRILHDHVPAIDFEADSITRKDGTKILNTNLKPKTIQIEGRIQDDTNTLEENIDTFKQTVNVTSGTLDISYASGTRRYKVTLASLVIDRDYFNIKFADYRMEFIVMTGDGRDTATTETLSVDGLTETTTSWEDMNFGGSLEPKPLIEYVIDTAGNLLDIQLTNDTTGTQISIGTAWSDGDILDIDTDNMTIERNGSDVEFEGIFPRFQTGDNDITSAFTKNTIEAQSLTSTSENNFNQWQRKLVAQSFVASGNITVEQVDIYIRKGSSSTESSVRIEIQTDNSGVPSDTAVTNGVSNNVEWADISTTSSWESFTFSTNPSLTSGNTYWIVAFANTAGTFEPDFFWSDDNTNPLSGGNAAQESKSSWAALSNVDMMFRIFKEEAATWEVSKKITYTKRYL